AANPHVRSGTIHRSFWVDDHAANAHRIHGNFGTRECIQFGSQIAFEITGIPFTGEEGDRETPRHPDEILLAGNAFEKFADMRQHAYRGDGITASEIL